MIDVHCHLDRFPNPKLVSEKARRAGVTIIAVTNLPSHFKDGVEPASRLSNVRLSLGLHPMLAPHSAQERQLFSQLLPKTSYIGEIGLDFSKAGKANREAQIDSFEFVLNQVQHVGKVLSIHSRKAERVIVDLLDKHRVRAATFHWFTGDGDSIDHVIKAGHYISINSAMVESEKSRDLVRRAPRERVLLESDGPYCKGRTGPVGPWDLPRIALKLADLWSCSVQEVNLQVARNFRMMLTDRHVQ